MNALDLLALGSAAALFPIRHRDFPKMAHPGLWGAFVRSTRSVKPQEMKSHDRGNHIMRGYYEH